VERRLWAPAPEAAFVTRRLDNWRSKVDTINHMQLLLSPARPRSRCIVCGQKSVVGRVLGRRQRNGLANFKCERCGARMHSVCYWNRVAGDDATKAFWVDNDAQHAVICAGCRS